MSSGSFKWCANIFAHPDGQEFWSARSTARFCSDRCRADWHRRLADARSLLADEDLRRHRPRRATTTTTTDAWAEVASRASDYDDYKQRMRPGAETAFRCVRCGIAFQAETRQEHCGLPCRDADRNAGR
ncbi:hypothetical protein Y900_004275 [Mycolicibacterium aromaticivorans JS19b1 = JCM 16368]|uniref:Uncharacterized protein n=1 Tax=Mycolicibacterium aromaticivorans JS19b1 = JCM 16368 TaxID=1440774 RepID=A0A064CC12_9MYCO|nr:hypothetical protein [Mycolicibacterium aromaticivorans]KDE98179.1 hypothetical protein Y900_004275 [Mycolicibacterium aromaticivorans JS19b1 = JCM 16368]